MGSRALLSNAKRSLDAFLESSASFRVVQTIPSHLAPSESATIQPRTLFILDASYNPSHLAHLTLARSALSSSSQRYAKPYRLLLLFSVHNATKSPGPAAFEQRMSMNGQVGRKIYLNDYH